MRDENKEEKKIKSIIIDSELKEWEEWGNKWFSGNQQDDVWSRDQDRRENTKKPRK
jgi:hypothetical protein